MIAIAAAAGLTCGTMMYHQVCSAFSPSMRAASSSSRGIVFMCWTIRKMKNAAAEPCRHPQRIQRVVPAELHARS